MRLSPEEMDLFNASCADSTNTHAQELMNVFGAEQAMTILDYMPAVPLGLLVDVISHIWLALTHETRRRGGGEYTPDFELV